MTIERAYFCDSPYQVFTCVHMQLHEKRTADLYILDAFANADRLVEQLRRRGLFRKVILIDTAFLAGKNTTLHKNVWKIRLRKMLSYLLVDGIVETFIDKDAVYDEMFFSCNQMSARLSRFYFIKKGHPTRFVFFDEGVGSYDGHFEHIHWTDRLARTLLYGKRADNEGLELYLYQPRLYVDYERRKDMVRRICPFDEIDRAYIDDYCEIFDSQPFRAPQRCVFFDTIREEIFNSEERFSRMQDWYQQIEDTLGADRLLLKPHPRAFVSYPHAAEEYPGSNCPMEINCLSMDLEKMCFLSLHSTAVISPKIIYDKEPLALVLCNVDKSVYDADEKLLELFRSVKALYRDPDRFMIPGSPGELAACLQRIRKEIEE